MGRMFAQQAMGMRQQQGPMGMQQGQTQEAFALPPPPPGSPAQQLMDYLRDFETSDPDAFVSATAEIADSLDAAAQEAGQGRAADFLSFLSGKFSEASEAGNLSTFGPPPGPPAGMMQGMSGFMQGVGQGPAQGMGVQGAQGPSPQNLFTQLMQLQQQEPDLFESLLGSVADTFSTASQSATGATAELLENLAARFSYAADTGDPVTLMPPVLMNNAAGAYQNAMFAPPPPDNGISGSIFADFLDSVKGGEA